MRARADRTGPREDGLETASKSRPSRVSRARESKARARRRIAAVAIVAATGILILGGILDLPYLNVARRGLTWARERIWPSAEEEKAGRPEYAFFTLPGTKCPVGDEASVLLGIYGNNDRGSAELLYILLFTYATEGGKGELYLIPENLTAYDAAGERRQLRDVLKAGEGEELLRSTVENMSGSRVDYLVLCDFRKAVRVLQGFRPPPICLENGLELRDPLSGEVDSIFAGQEIGDADRLLLYLMAADHSDAWEAYYARLDRLARYLPDLQGAIAACGEVPPEGDLLEGGEGLRMVPDAGSPERNAAYMYSMLRALAEAGEGDVRCVGVPRVEVLNGCGVPELGKAVGKKLNELGIPVAGTTGNAKVVVDGEEVNDFSHLESEIVCRNGDRRSLAFARYLGVLLSVQNIREEAGSDAALTVITGRDLASRFLGIP